LKTTAKTPTIYGSQSEGEYNTNKGEDDAVGGAPDSQLFEKTHGALTDFKALDLHQTDASHKFSHIRLFVFAPLGSEKNFQQNIRQWHALLYLSLHVRNFCSFYFSHNYFSNFA